MRKLVLVVEDDRHLRDIYARALTHHGYKVITATNGAEGVHIARKQRPEMILLDLKMPVMDGYEALRYLRAFRETAKIPVLTISAYGQKDDERYKSRAMQFNSVLRKPVDPQEIVIQVEQRIGPPAPPLWQS